MNDTPPGKQHEVLTLLEDKYMFDYEIVSEVYFPYFMDNKNAEYVLQKIHEFESESDGFEEVRYKIESFFSSILVKHFIYNQQKENEKQ